VARQGTADSSRACAERTAAQCSILLRRPTCRQGKSAEDERHTHTSRHRLLRFDLRYLPRQQKAFPHRSALLAEPSLNPSVHGDEEERAMVMTTLEAEKTLAALDRLVAIFDKRIGILDGEQRRLLQRLRERQRTLRQLVAAREKERTKKIIDFALWRDDPPLPPEPEAELDASVV
jgi:hypothetical protein